MKVYRFLTAPDDASFCHKVTLALNKGWELHGSPTYAYNADAKIMQCGQAVVKDVPRSVVRPLLPLGVSRHWAIRPVIRRREQISSS